VVAFALSVSLSCLILAIERCQTQLKRIADEYTKNSLGNK
jgi:hypothetical protein